MYTPILPQHTQCTHTYSTSTFWTSWIENLQCSLKNRVTIVKCLAEQDYFIDMLHMCVC